MKVFRIEHKTRGVGPYNGSASMNYEYFADRHPAPQMDGILNIGRDFYYGFANMRQMFQWFNWKDVFRWRREGFRVYKYTLAPQSVQVGGHQVAFVKASALSRQEVRAAVLARHLVRRPLFGS